jgi:hypothetical protein
MSSPYESYFPEDASLRLPERRNAHRDVSFHVPGRWSEGTAGFSRTERVSPGVRLWQLTGPLERRTVDGAREAMPSAPAVPLWYRRASTGVSAGWFPATDWSRQERIYHTGFLPSDVRAQVTAIDDGSAGAEGIGQWTIGDRVPASWNPQSGRWELTLPPQDFWRFELLSSLTSSSSPYLPRTALARLVCFDVDSQAYLTSDVYFTVADYMNAFTGSAGYRGYARRLSDSAPSLGWEIIALAGPGVSSSSSGSASSGASSSSSSGGDKLYPGSSIAAPTYFRVSFRGESEFTCDDWSAQYWKVPFVEEGRYILAGPSSPYSYESQTLPCDPDGDQTRLEIRIDELDATHYYLELIATVPGVYTANFYTSGLKSSLSLPIDLVDIPLFYFSGDTTEPCFCNWMTAACTVESF